jgi:carbon-monoxide dehydrogenase medium subunit
MKPPVFDYYDPETLDEALDLMDRYGPEAKVLAGGQSLVPLLNLRLARPAALVDLNRIPGMDAIHLEDGWIRIGAMARQWDVEHAPEVVRHLPILAEALRFVGHPQIRMRGTVGGSIAHADPAAELPALLLCLEGEVVARRRAGIRVIPAKELFVTYLTTSLEPDEILTEVRWPIPSPGTGWAFVELARRHGDYALVGVAVLVRLNADGSVAEARIAFTDCGPVPVRAEEAERALRGAHPSARLWEEAAQAAASLLDPPSDLHASGAYRKHVAAVLTARALSTAVERANPGGEG